MSSNWSVVWFLMVRSKGRSLVLVPRDSGALPPAELVAALQDARCPDLHERLFAELEDRENQLWLRLIVT